MLTSLGNLSGAKFDREYTKDQVAGHEAAVAVFQQEIDGGQDADVKGFATQTLPTIKQHLQEAQGLNGGHMMKMMHHHKAAPMTDDSSSSSSSSAQ